LTAKRGYAFGLVLESNFGFQQLVPQLSVFFALALKLHVHGTLPL
jgi:hypothetical protein